MDVRWQPCRTGCVWTPALTRALEEGRFSPPPTCFSWNTQIRRRAAPPNLGCLRKNQKYILCVAFDLLISKVQVARSGQSQMCTPGPVSNFKIVLWAVGTALVRTFSNVQDDILDRIPTECIFFVLVTSGQVNFWPGPVLGEITGGNYSSVHNFWTKGDRRTNWYQRVSLVAPNQMIPNMTNFDLAWPVTAN